MYYLFNTAELDSGLCSASCHAKQINLCNLSMYFLIYIKAIWYTENKYQANLIQLVKQLF